MLNIEEQRAPRGFALLNLGFRIFFPGAAVFAVLAMLAWAGMTVFGWQVQPYGLAGMSWHAHEMVFGYAMAVVAGFLLTAIRNWTGIQTLNGTPLLLLFLLWLAGRLLPFFDVVPVEYLAVVDNLFLVLLIVSASVPIVKVKQWAQLGILSKLVLLLASNVLFYAGLLGWLENGIALGIYSGLYLLLALILVMARRVVPFFIEKGVGYAVQLQNRKWLDISSLLLFLVFWIADVFMRYAGLAGILAAALFVLHVIRMHGWHTPGIWRKPLLWVLYLGYGSIVAGFAIKASASFFGISPYLAVHAFAVGGIGMMTVGMMARVTLGHTGRDMTKPPRILTGTFLLLSGSVLARVLAPLVDTGHYLLWIVVSQLLWIIAFAVFLYVYTPMFLRPRVDGRPG